MAEVTWRLARIEDSREFDASIHNAHQRSLHAELEDQERGIHSLYLGYLNRHIIGSGFIHWEGPRSKEVQKWDSVAPEIFRLSIDPKFQSCGFGSNLIQIMEKQACSQGFAAVGLGVSIENARALQLYRRLGYSEVLVREYIDHYLYERGDGQVMTAYDKCMYLIKRF